MSPVLNQQEGNDLRSMKHLAGKLSLVQLFSHADKENTTRKETCTLHTSNIIANSMQTSCGHACVQQPPVHSIAVQVASRTSCELTLPPRLSHPLVLSGAFCLPLVRQAST